MLSGNFGGVVCLCVWGLVKRRFVFFFCVVGVEGCLVAWVGLVTCIRFFVFGLVYVRNQ